MKLFRPETVENKKGHPEKRVKSLQIPERADVNTHCMCGQLFFTVYILACVNI